MAKKIRKLSYYKNKAWKAFSIYIRTRDCLATTKTAENGKCVTCNRVFPFEELQAGHAIGGRNNAILFDEELVNAQCRGCNSYGNGRYAEYSVWFINRYGIEKWEEKVRLSRSVVKYNIPYYIAKEEEYKNKIKLLTSGSLCNSI